MNYFLPPSILLTLYSLGLVLSYPVTDLLPGESYNKISTNKTITDATLRALLGQLKIYLEPVQPLPDESYEANSTANGYVNVGLIGASVTDLTVYSIDVAHANLTELTFDFQLTFNAVNATGDYILHVNNDLLDLEGSGGLHLNTTDVTVMTKLELQLNSNNTLEMKNVTTDLTFDYIKVDLENLGGNADISVYLNDFMNRFIAEAMKTLKPTIEEEMINPRLMTLGNFLVRGMTVDHLIDFINNYA